MSTKPRRRLRVSLLSLFLLTTVVALSLTVWRGSRRIAVLRGEVTDLRLEAGRLWFHESQQDRLHADFTKPQQLNLDRFVWRVYVPERSVGRLRLALYQDSMDRTVVGEVTLDLPPGERDVEVEARQRLSDQRWEYRLLDHRYGRVARGFVGPQPPWVIDDDLRTGGGSFLGTGNVGGLGAGESFELWKKQREVEPGETLESVLTIELLKSK